MGSGARYRVSSRAASAWLLDHTRNSIMLLSHRIGHEDVLEACFDTVQRACLAAECGVEPAATPLLPYALQYFLTHACLLQSLSKLSIIYSRVSFIQLRASAGSLSCGQLLIDYVAGVECCERIASAGSGPASKQKLIVTATSTARLLRLYYAFLQEHVHAIVAAPQCVWRCASELDPTDIVYQRTRAQRKRATSRLADASESSHSDDDAASLSGSSDTDEEALDEPALSLTTTAVSLHATLRSQAAVTPTVIPQHATHVLKGHCGWVNGVGTSDDGRRVASCGADNTVRIWQAETGKLITTLEPGVLTSQLMPARHADSSAPRRESSLWCVAINGDGTRVAAAGEDSIVYVWDVETHRQLFALTGYEGHTSWVSGLSMDPTGRTLLSCGSDASVRLWDLATGALVHAYKGHTGTVWACALMGDVDARLSVSVGADGTCRVWDAMLGTARSVFAVSAGAQHCVSACSMAPGRVVMGGWDGTVACWDAVRMQCLWKHTAHADATGSPAVRAVWLSEDGRFVFSGADSGTVVRVDADTGDEAVTLRGHTDSVTSIMSSFDGLRAFSGSRDGTVRAWTFT